MKQALLEELVKETSTNLEPSYTNSDCYLFQPDDWFE